MISPREAREVKAKIARGSLTIADQAELARHISGDSWRVPSNSEPGLYRTVRMDLLICDCPGFWIAQKHNHYCRHIRAVSIRIARELLEIFGEPNIDALNDAIRYVENGLIRRRYIANGGDSPRYGYAPNRRAGIRFSIGLSERARERSLTMVEQVAVIWSLEQMRSQCPQDEKRAA